MNREERTRIGHLFVKLSACKVLPTRMYKDHCFLIFEDYGTIFLGHLESEGDIYWRKYFPLPRQGLLQGLVICRTSDVEWEYKQARDPSGEFDPRAHIKALVRTGNPWYPIGLRLAKQKGLYNGPI